MVKRNNNQRQKRQNVVLAFKNHFEVLEQKYLLRKNKIRKESSNTINIAKKNIRDVVELYCGKMNYVCSRGCNAFHFKDERTQTLCCDENGLGSHIFLRKTPRFINELLKDKAFRDKIRDYNNTLQIATLGSTLGAEAIEVQQYGNFNIKVHGSIYHSIPPVIALSNPRFAQLYIVDNAVDTMTKRELEIFGKARLEKKVLSIIYNYLSSHNPWAKAIKRHAKKLLLNKLNVKKIQMNVVHGEGQFNAPTQQEIAAFIPNHGTTFHFNRSVMLHQSDGKFSSINELNIMYDPLHYVIMFPHGEKGFAPTDGTTVLKFYQQRLMVRPDCSLPKYGRLFHEYVVDQYCKVEQTRLNYIQKNQINLRSAKTNEERPEEMPIGPQEGSSFVYLPSSFQGGPRFYRRRYLDAINAVNILGAASFFITITCNPNWPEIQQCLQNFEVAADRPDVIARVFKMKFDELLDDLTKRHVLGLCIGHLAVTEFQKRGLPHGHILLIVDTDDRPKCPSSVDSCVCAELPDKQSDSYLFNLVTKHMLHGPCNQYCYKGQEKCRFGYPKSYRESTAWDGDSRIEYRRRNDGNNFISKTGKVFTNSDVVPYNPWLLKKYSCHINVLVCSTKISSIRYLFSYNFKGQDMATVKFNLEREQDKVNNYLSGRYISAPEAIWKMLSFGILEIKPPTIRLPVHLPGERFEVLGKVGEKRRRTCGLPSELEAFFILNTERSLVNSDFSFKLKYTDISRYFVWERKTHRWAPRKRIDGNFFGVVLNQMDNVSVNTGERYYLRLLLHYVYNPTSFDDVKTVNGCVHETFQGACLSKGLLSNDNTWKKTMEEAILTQTPHNARHVFAQILSYGNLNDPLNLFNDYVTEMSEDFRRENDDAGMTSDVLKKTIFAIEMHLKAMSRSLAYYAPLAHLIDNKTAAGTIFREEQVFTYEENEKFKNDFISFYASSNKKQKHVLDKLVSAFDCNTPERLYILMAAAGTGKTFVQNTFIQYVKSKSEKNTTFVTMSTTAVSAQLLEEGRTAHSTLKLPIEILHGNVNVGISLDSDLALQLRDAKVIIWDEIFAARKELIEAVDVFFQELHQKKTLFGGKVVILSGDIRQTLPKINHATRSQICDACITKSHIFPFFSILHLTENMRMVNSLIPEYARYLLEVGDGRGVNELNQEVQLPTYIKKANSINELITKIYSVELLNLSRSELAQRAIITPLNEDVRCLNSIALGFLRGQEVEYLSEDNELDQDGRIVYDLPIEILNEMNRSGLPPHRLNLKVKAVIMCLRNMSRNVCNGTKLQVEKMHSHLLECSILTGPARGKNITLPRITLIDKSSKEGVILRRKQFPICLAYAMTIDKSQGQSLDLVGIYLQHQCFAHGQLYTALSRCRDASSIIVLYSTDDQETVRNVVWKEVFPA